MQTHHPNCLEVGITKSEQTLARQRHVGIPFAHVNFFILWFELAPEGLGREAGVGRSRNQDGQQEKGKGAMSAHAGDKSIDRDYNSN